MPSEATNEATRRAWRELGFFCDRNDAAKEWRIVGSVKGLRKFASEIRKYASSPANDRPSEYQHFGPSMNLEIGTWHQTEITEQWIGGPLTEFLRLAALIERSAQDNVVGVEMLHLSKRARKADLKRLLFETLGTSASQEFLVREPSPDYGKEKS